MTKQELIDLFILNMSETAEVAGELEGLDLVDTRQQLTNSDDVIAKAAEIHYGWVQEHMPEAAGYGLDNYVEMYEMLKEAMEP